LGKILKCGRLQAGSKKRKNINAPLTVVLFFRLSLRTWKTQVEYDSSRVAYSAIFAIRRIEMLTILLKRNVTGFSLVDDDECLPLSLYEVRQQIEIDGTFYYWQGGLLRCKYGLPKNEIEKQIVAEINKLEIAEKQQFWS
jgi:hypothetical protein